MTANANSGNATTATFTPISNQIQSILSNALSEVKSLKGQPQDVILANADGTGQLTVPQLATQVDGLVTTVVSPLSNVQSLDLLSGGDLLTVLNSVMYVPDACSMLYIYIFIALVQLSAT